MSGGHLFHMFHFLFHEWKLGGAIAVIGAAIGLFVVNEPVTVQTGCTTLLEGKEICTGTALNPEGVAAHLGGAVVGGAVGTGLALFLTAVLGIDKDDLGIPDE